MSKLRPSYRGLNFAHAIIHAQDINIIQARSGAFTQGAVIAKGAAPSKLMGQRRIIGCHHAAFDGRHVLDWIERKAARQAQRPRLLVTPGRIHGKGTVFQYKCTFLLCHSKNAVHITGKAQIMHGHDHRQGPLSGFQRGRVHIACCRIDIDKHRLRPDKLYTVGGCHMGHGGHGDTIPRADVAGEQRQVQTRRTG